MKTTLMTVSLLLATYVCHAQRFFEPTNGSWVNQNLSVETYQDLVITGFTETNPNTGLLAPGFKITDLSGIGVTSFFVDYSDAMYLMDFTIRESTGTIILTGMTAVTDEITPHKLYVTEVDYSSGTIIQTFIEYPYNLSTMIPHRVICSEESGQVTVVGTKVIGLLAPDNYASIPKHGFVLGLDVNDLGSILYTPIEMDTPWNFDDDYDMLENLTEVNGYGYFISGSANDFEGKQCLITMGIDYGGNVNWSRLIDNSDYRFAGASVDYNASQGIVYLLANNSMLHQFQIAQCNPFTGGIGALVSHQITSLPIGGGVEQNGFRLQMSPSEDLILIGGYLNSLDGSMSELLTPFEMTLSTGLGFQHGKWFQSGNNSPLSPSYFEEDGTSPFINTPDMFVFNLYSTYAYIASQNDVNGGYDLNVASIRASSGCEKEFKTEMFEMEPNIIGEALFNPLEMYAEPYYPEYQPREFYNELLCEGISGIALKQGMISPNPANDQLHIELEAGEKIRNSVIYDMNGSIVLDHASLRTRNEMTVPVETLKTGIYMILIRTMEGNTYRERFIKK